VLPAEELGVASEPEETYDPPTSMTLYRIEAPHFVAGFVTRYNTVAVTAPILSWLLGSNIKWVRNCCQEKSWKLDQLPKRARVRDELSKE
jgi:hypothetical protein